MRRLLLIMWLALPNAALAVSDVSKVNGSIEIAADEQAGELSTVNGAIRIAAGATVKSAHTVNGSITLGERVAADSLRTVNGRITLGAHARVSRDVSNVNGEITLGRNADVQGRVVTVNGDIRLDAAHVGGGIRAVESDIEVGAGSRLEGGIHVEKESGGWFNFSFWYDPPRIVIGPGAVVQGTLRFEREVELYVSDTATIGPVEGAEVVRFSGASP